MQGKVRAVTAIVGMALLLIWRAIDLLLLRKAPVAELDTEFTIYALLWLPVLIIALWFAVRRRIRERRQRRNAE